MTRARTFTIAIAIAVFTAACSETSPGWTVAGSPPAQSPTSATEASTDRAPGASAEPGAAVEAAARPYTTLVIAAKLRGKTSYDLYAVRDDGAEMRALTDTPDVDETLPSISPDRQRIAFVRGGAMWVMDASGEAAHTVGMPLATPASPAAWSPSGERLVYASPDEAGVPRLRAASWTGLEDAPFMPDVKPGYALSEPAWGASGQFACVATPTLASVADRPGLFELSGRMPWKESLVANEVHGLDIAAKEGRWTFVWVGPEGGGADAYGELLVSFGTAPSDAWVVRAGGARAPRWSPDGHEIAYVGREGVFVLSAFGSVERQVLRAADVAGMDW